jgi:ketosteroid isomerase-like protein
MRKLYFILTIAVVITACQQTPKTISVDIKAEKDAIAALFDKYYSAMNEQDVTTLISCFTEDVLCCGTDPSEFWNKQEMNELWTQWLANSGFEPNFIGEREIKVATDGNSATIVDQYLHPTFSPIIQIRNTYHVVKTNDKWMILFWSVSFIPKNEDISKLNEALE